ncbi:hypothetical protein CRV08_12170 [Halarcobacter ebronensis]|uniref:NADPH-dependent FMN reductase-like domain-containing protein n=1 Tax=Halarcobacter ebronensis TaxID=1462615 RepID=A0A4Q0YAA4_9BACT|nr:flavodoxin family protein [Halarcobacter ebronensis]RXJ66815.1 hypothetical protein CRV08_12170 [Halarcobacter ebronensis]
MRVLFIDCSEKYHKQIDTIIEYLYDYFHSLDIYTSKISLSNLKITKCTQCRCCTLKWSESPVKCVVNDEMSEVIDTIQEANSYVILSDRTFLFNKNKVHEKFSERLVAYYYWPYGQSEARLRNPFQNKNSILINFNTTKYFMNHSFYTTKLYMEHTSASIGAKVQDWTALTPKEDLIKEYKERLDEMAYKLVSAFQRNAS